MCIVFLFSETSLGSPTFVFSGYRGAFPAQVMGLGCATDPHLHLVPRLGMSGAIPLLPHYAFLACTATVVPYIYPIYFGLIFYDEAFF
jgi:hypothetical protein